MKKLNIKEVEQSKLTTVLVIILKQIINDKFQIIMANHEVTLIMEVDKLLIPCHLLIVQVTTLKEKAIIHFID